MRDYWPYVRRQAWAETVKLLDMPLERQLTGGLVLLIYLGLVWTSTGEEIFRGEVALKIAATVAPGVVFFLVFARKLYGFPPRLHADFEGRIQHLRDRIEDLTRPLPSDVVVSLSTRGRVEIDTKGGPLLRHMMVTVKNSGPQNLQECQIRLAMLEIVGGDLYVRSGISITDLFSIRPDEEKDFSLMHYLFDAQNSSMIIRSYHDEGGHWQKHPHEIILPANHDYTMTVEVLAANTRPARLPVTLSHKDQTWIMACV